MKKENIIVTKSFDFALEILDLYLLLREQKHFELASQIVKSGTSIGANVRESQRAASTKDFVNKLRIALKEAEETKYWFQLLDRKIINIDNNLFSKIDEIIRLLVSIINSSNKNNN